MVRPTTSSRRLAPDGDLADAGAVQRAVVERELRALGFSLALVLCGELVVQVSGWSRFWVYVVVLVVGHCAAAAVRGRRRTRVAADDGRASPR